MVPKIFDLSIGKLLILKICLINNFKIVKFEARTQFFLLKCEGNRSRGL